MEKIQTQHYHGLIFEPEPFTPQSFWDEFNRIVPLSANGVDRKLRYVWGNSRTEYVEGQQVVRYADLDNHPAKYVGRCRFLLEGWQSPSVYDQAEWEKYKDILGEWPRNGVWDFIEVHEDAEGNYLPLDHTAIERVKSWAFWNSKDRARSIEFLLEQRALRLALQAERDRIAAQKVSAQFGEEVVKVLENNKNPVHSLPAQKQEIGGFKKTQGGILIPA